MFFFVSHSWPMGLNVLSYQSYHCNVAITIMPVVTKDLHISLRSSPYECFSRCKFSTLTTRQLMVEFYLNTHVLMLSGNQNKNHDFVKNRSHDLCTIDYRLVKCMNGGGGRCKCVGNQLGCLWGLGTVYIRTRGEVSKVGRIEVGEHARGGMRGAGEGASVHEGVERGHQTWLTCAQGVACLGTGHSVSARGGQCARARTTVYVRA